MPIDMSSGQSNGGFLFPGYFCSWYHGKDQPAHHTRIFDSKISTWTNIPSLKNYYDEEIKDFRMPSSCKYSEKPTNSYN